MRLKGNFLTYSKDNDTYILPPVDSGFKGIIRGNETLGSIIALLSHDTSEEEITRAIVDEYDAPYEAVKADVKRAVEILRGIGAVDE